MQPESTKVQMVVEAKFGADKNGSISISRPAAALPATPSAARPTAHDTINKTLAPPQFLPAPGLPACARPPHRLPRVRRAPRHRAVGTARLRLHAPVRGIRPFSKPSMGSVLR